MKVATQAAQAAATAMAQVIQEATDTKTGDVAGVFFNRDEVQTLEKIADRLLESHQTFKHAATNNPA
jgi:hypothetical protein